MTVAVPLMSERAALRPALPALLRNMPANGIRIALLLGVLALLNGIDLDYTLFAYRIGMLDEMNPLAAAYLAAGLKPSFIAYKLLMFLAGSVMLWRVRKSVWAAPACWMLVGVYVALGVLWYEWAREVTQMYEVRLTLSF